MKIWYLSSKPPSVEGGLDPRRANLYGDDVICLVPSAYSGPYAVADIGPIWNPERPGQRVAAGLADRVAALRQRNPEGALVVGSYEIAEALLGSGLRFVFDPTDSASLFYLRRFRHLCTRSPMKAANSLRLMARYGRMERAIGAEAAAFITTGPADEAHLRALCPAAHIVRVGNGTALISQPPIEPCDDGRTVGFHGGMNWEPNRTTAERLASLVAKRLNGRGDELVRVRIAGGPVPPSLAACDGKNGAEICGFIENLREWLATISLYVMPMYQGSGVKNKLVEAMAMGVPIITNELGAEALDMEARACIVVARSDQELVGMIRKLLKDPKALAQMRVKGRRYAQRHFEWNQYRQALHAELEALTAAGRL